MTLADDVIEWAAAPIHFYLLFTICFRLHFAYANFTINILSTTIAQPLEYSRVICTLHKIK